MRMDEAMRRMTEEGICCRRTSWPENIKFVYARRCPDKTYRFYTHYKDELIGFGIPRIAGNETADDWVDYAHPSLH